MAEGNVACFLSRRSRPFNLSPNLLGVLQIRIYALYLLDKRILAFTLTSFLASSAISAMIMGRELHRISGTAVFLSVRSKGWGNNDRATALALPLPTPGGDVFCVPIGVTPGSHFYFFWIPMICFESLLCALAISRSLRISTVSPFFRNGQKLLEILFRDSLIYFFAYDFSRSLTCSEYSPVMFSIGATYLTAMLFWIFSKRVCSHRHPLKGELTLLCIDIVDGDTTRLLHRFPMCFIQSTHSEHTRALQILQKSAAPVKKYYHFHHRTDLSIHRFI